MRRFKHGWVALVAVALLFATEVAVAAPDPARLDRLLDRIDDLWRGKSSRAKVSMKVKTAHYERQMRMEAWSRGKDRSLIRILSPRKEKGTATLKSKNNLYTYLPKTNRTIRLTSGMMGSSWMGSHFTNDDLVKQSRLRKDYDAKITFEGDRGGQKIIEITLIPKTDAAVVWGKIVSTLTAVDELPLAHVYYDEDMNVARTMTLSKVTTFKGRKLPAVMKVVPADKPGEFTEMTYEDLEFDIDISDAFFSITRLRKR